MNQLKREMFSGVATQNRPVVKSCSTVVLQTLYLTLTELTA